MKHLKEEQAALLAGGELHGMQGAACRLHVAGCKECREKVREYSLLRQDLKGKTEEFRLPKGFDWAELEAEMMGNIRLGAEVASVTPPVRRLTEEWMDWRGVVAIAALTAVVMTGWFLTGPASRSYPRTAGWSRAAVAGGDVFLSATPVEVGFEREGSGVFFRSAVPTATRVEVGLEGSLRAASIDQDSGQLTVTQVSLEEEEPAGKATVVHE